MSVTASEVETLLAAERTQLVTVLTELGDDGWTTPSLCTGWRVRELVAHLLMPYELSVPGFLGRLITARFSFDVLADRFATRDPRTDAELVAALSATAEQRWNVPGSPVEAPLSHLVIHAQDVLLPLGVEHTPAPRAAALVLDQLLIPRAEGLRTPGLLDGLTLVASDVDWRRGEGDEVHGPASALLATMAGRTGALGALSGPGATRLRTRA